MSLGSVLLIYGCPLCQEEKKGGMNERLEELWQLREEKHKCRREMDGLLR